MDSIHDFGRIVISYIYRENEEECYYPEKLELCSSDSATGIGR